MFQPGRLVVAKRRGTAGVLLHTGIVTACTALALLGNIARLWPAVLLVGLAHLAIEYLSIRARSLMEATGLALFLLDQALHIVSIAVIAVCLGDGRQPIIGLWPTSLALLAVACGMLASMFLGSILAFEVRVAALGGDASDLTGPILRMDGSRIFGFFERGLALGVAVFAPVPLLGALVFLPRVAYSFTHSGAVRARNMNDAAVGLSICAVAWLFIVLTTSVRF